MDTEIAWNCFRQIYCFSGCFCLYPLRCSRQLLQCAHVLLFVFLREHLLSADCLVSIYNPIILEPLLVSIKLFCFSNPIWNSICARVSFLNRSLYSLLYCVLCPFSAQCTMIVAVAGGHFSSWRRKHNLKMLIRRQNKTLRPRGVL